MISSQQLEAPTTCRVIDVTLSTSSLKSNTCVTSLLSVWSDDTSERFLSNASAVGRWNSVLTKAIPA